MPRPETFYVVLGLTGLAVGGVASVLHSWDLLLVGYLASGASVLFNWIAHSRTEEKVAPRQDVSLNAMLVEQLAHRRRYR